MIETATIEIERAERMMKALCNHFSRKITAHYEGDRGFIDFGNGTCELTASSDTLHLRATAGDAADLEHVKNVVIRHLARFMSVDDLPVTWVEQD